MWEPIGVVMRGTLTQGRHAVHVRYKFQVDKRNPAYEKIAMSYLRSLRRLAMTRF